MKIAILFYHSIFDEEIRSLLGEMGCARYVEVPRAWAQDGPEKRFDSNIYPGSDSIIMAFLDDACAARLGPAIRHFQVSRKQEHTHVAIIDVGQFV